VLDIPQITRMWRSNWRNLALLERARLFRGAQGPFHSDPRDAFRGWRRRAEKTRFRQLPNSEHCRRMQVACGQHIPKLALMRLFVSPRLQG
jgi:hypothetical protein